MPMTTLGALRCLTLALLGSAVSMVGCTPITPSDTDADDRSPVCSAAEERQCAEALASAQELIDTHAACSPGDSCAIVSEPSLGIACSPSVLFYCPFAVNTRTDTSVFIVRAKELSDRAQVCLKCRSACAIPSCVPPGSVSATCSTVGRCVLQAK